MPKSRAEIQRAYRERQKEKDKEEYLRKERERKRRNYVGSHELSEKDRKERNRKNRANLRAYYARKRAERLRQVTRNSGTSGYESNVENAVPSSSETPIVRPRGRLVVRLDFDEKNKGKQKAALKRWKRDRSTAQSRIRLLEQERDKLKTKLKSTQKSLQRLKKATEASNSTRTLVANLTPNKQTEHDMNQASLNREQRQKLRKALLLGNVISNEIRQTKTNTPRHKMKALHTNISGKITKKYKCIACLSAKTGLGRRQLGKISSKNHQLQTRTRRNKLEKYRECVINFLKREDNSRMQPGKHDSKRIQKGEKVQVQILTDYLKNLFLKFQSENQDIDISFATFCRSRPSYIFKTSMTSRISCLCMKHQNAALTVKAVRRYLEDQPRNPELLITKKPSEEQLTDTLPEEVAVSQWTRVETEEKGKKKTVTRTVEKEMSKDSFIKHFQAQMDEFKEHVERVHIQYEQIKKLKKELPKHHMIVQLDFAENYSCRSHEEVQSAYFNQSSVTLHPMVAYWKEEDDIIVLKSFVTVSDELSHKSSTVLTFLDDLIPELKKIDPALDTIHYWSDSPSSQYRNKYIFDAIANHKEIYGCHGRWNYFESGHGKGPCDGLGGTSKRIADEATRSGRYVISDAMEFYKWGKASNLKNVTFRFVSKDQCASKAQKLSERHVKPITGTMKLHAVVGKGKSKILIRNTSCYCTECMIGNMCGSWKEASTFNETPQNETEMCSNTTNSVTDMTKVVSIRAETSIVSVKDLRSGVFVAAVYQQQWYIGQITDTDETEVEIDFMEKKKQLFRWPSQKDQIWIKNADILCTLEEPKATGKSSRMFKLEDSVITLIQKKFESCLEN